MSTTLIERERPAHWYHADGTACHTQPKKDGTGDRATTLADARKLGLYPSVTSILSVKAKPGLDAWKLEQGILSALTLPRGSEETIDAFAKRVVQDMEAETARAAEWGTRIHEECEGLHKTGVLVRNEDTYAYMQGYETWFAENVAQVIEAETTVVNTMQGYAGRIDLLARLTDGRIMVIDLKTQKVKNNRPAFYPEWGMQLAAYREALPEYDDIGMMSVVINSAEPSPVAVKEWEKPLDYMRAFECCLSLWQFERGYSPVSNL